MSTVSSKSRPQVHRRGVHRASNIILTFLNNYCNLKFPTWSPKTVLLGEEDEEASSTNDYCTSAGFCNCRSQVESCGSRTEIGPWTCCLLGWTPEIQVQTSIVTKHKNGPTWFYGAGTGALDLRDKTQLENSCNKWEFSHRHQTWKRQQSSSNGHFEKSKITFMAKKSFRTQRWWMHQVRKTGRAKSLWFWGFSRLRLYHAGLVFFQGRRHHMLPESHRFLQILFGCCQLVWHVCVSGWSKQKNQPDPQDRRENLWRQFWSSRLPLLGDRNYLPLL